MPIENYKTVPLGKYNSSFTVNGTPTYFDVQRNGYQSNVEANRNVFVIPWSQTYAPVIQRGGRNPMPRHYRALVYSEADYIALALLVNQPGLIVTPRETQPTLANLDSVTRGPTLDGTDPNGLTEVELAFTLLE